MSNPNEETLRVLETLRVCVGLEALMPLNFTDRSPHFSAVSAFSVSVIQIRSGQQLLTEPPPAPCITPEEVHSPCKPAAGSVSGRGTRPTPALPHGISQGPKAKGPRAWGEIGSV